MCVGPCHCVAISFDIYFQNVMFVGASRPALKWPGIWIGPERRPHHGNAEPRDSGVAGQEWLGFEVSGFKEGGGGSPLGTGPV